MDDARELHPLLDVDEPIVIVVRHELPSYAQQLLVSLGAGWIIDPEHGERCATQCGQPECNVSSAPQLEQLIVVEILDGRADTSHVHLAEPGQDPHQSSVRTLCGTTGSVYAKRGAFRDAPWCDQCTTGGVPAPTVADAVLADVDDYLERRSPMAIATGTCKHCTNDVEDTRGIYAGLCSHHKQLARAARASGATGGGNLSNGRSTGAISDGYTARVRALIPAAKKLDQTKRKLDGGNTQERLKAEFDEASNRARAVPNDENLEKLEAATKALRKGAPVREKAQRSFSEAERAFKLALAAIARDFRVQ